MVNLIEIIQRKNTTKENDPTPNTQNGQICWFYKHNLETLDFKTFYVIDLVLTIPGVPCSLLDGVVFAYFPWNYKNNSF